MFYQKSPRMHCRLYGKGGCCDNPRCSLACRRKYAELESEVMGTYLQSLSPSVFVYAGTLKVDVDIDKPDHKAIRTAFLASLPNVSLKVIGEVSDDLRVHYHYVMVSATIVDDDDVRQWWQSACQGRKVTVYHHPVKDVIGWSKYIFGHTPKKRAFQRLMVSGKGELRLTWGTRSFFPFGFREPIVKAFKDRRKARHLAQPHPIIQVVPSPIKPVSGPTRDDVNQWFTVSTLPVEDAQPESSVVTVSERPARTVVISPAVVRLLKPVVGRWYPWAGYLPLPIAAKRPIGLAVAFPPVPTSQPP